MKKIKQRVAAKSINTNDVAVDERKIDDFIGPYLIFATPYYKTDFSEVTRRICLGDSSLQLDASDYLRICKIIIVGDVSVGKTSIVNRNMFQTSYKSTIGVDFEMEKYNILGVPYILQIWDTAGQERFKCIAQSYYRNSHVVVLVFDLTNQASLSNLRTWYFEAIKACGSMLPYIFVVGSKKDLVDPFEYKSIELNATKMAKSLNAEYWPISSKKGENINTLFDRIAVLAFDDYIRNEMSQLSDKSIGSYLIPLEIHDSRRKKSRHKCGVPECQK